MTVEAVVFDWYGDIPEFIYVEDSRSDASNLGSEAVGRVAGSGSSGDGGDRRHAEALPGEFAGMCGYLDTGKQAGEQPGGSTGTVISIFVIEQSSILLNSNRFPRRIGTVISFPPHKFPF